MSVFGKRFPLIVAFLLLTLGALGFVKYQQASSSKSTTLPGSVKIASEEPVSELSEVTSADGSVKVVTNKITQSTGNTIYTFTTQDKDGSNSINIYKTALAKGENIDAPANAWSPNNKYLFLKQKTAKGNSYFVFNRNGDKFGDSEFIDVGKIFDGKENGFGIADITGWDSDTLLHVDAKSKSGEKAHFWFEVPDGAVIRLAR